MSFCKIERIGKGIEAENLHSDRHMAATCEEAANIWRGICTKTERVQEKTTYPGIILHGSARN